MNPTRRRLRVLCVFLLLGAEVNVGVAWVAAYAMVFSKYICDVPDDYYTRPPWYFGAWQWARPKYPDYRIDDIFWGTEFYGADWKWFSAWVAPPDAWRDWYTDDGLGVPVGSCGVFCAGWPMHSMCASMVSVQEELEDDVSWQYALHPGANLPSHMIIIENIHSDPEQCTCLPTLPIWTGFAINTLFYAATCWLLLAAPGVARRRWRTRRGRCPHCAYPVGASPLCTECGKPVAQPQGGNLRV